MKIFFVLLLIANIVFGLVQWLVPYKSSASGKTNVPVSEELVLLNETKSTPVVAQVTGDVAEIDQQGEVEATGSQITEEKEDTQLCYTIGPFKDRKRAVEISGRYAAEQLDTDLKSAKEKEYLGVMVYLDGHASRAEAIKTANSLAEEGITDHIIVNEEGKTNVLSLGVFGLKKNAEGRIATLRKLDYQPRSEARYRERTIYWLYSQQASTSELLSLLDNSDLDKGISQIPTQCG